MLWGIVFLVDVSVISSWYVQAFQRCCCIPIKSAFERPIEQSKIGARVKYRSNFKYTPAHRADRIRPIKMFDLLLCDRSSCTDSKKHNVIKSQTG